MKYIYRELYRIPQYLVQEITDVGAEQIVEKDEDGIHSVDNDDLHICIVLSAGINVYLTGDVRIQLTPSELIIEGLVAL